MPSRTVIGRRGSGSVAGPPATEPSVIRNRLPWQKQLIVPAATARTVHPRCGQVLPKAT